MVSEEIQILKPENSKRVLSKKKLHLVLDLTRRNWMDGKIEKLTEDEKLLMDGKLDAFVFKNEYLIKLRPFVREFLEAASVLFEISICSMATRDYVARFLDPQGTYFGNRLISREDLGQREVKNLDLIL